MIGIAVRHLQHCSFEFSFQVVNAYKGENHPIMSLHERVLSVLAYKVMELQFFAKH